MDKLMGKEVTLGGQTMTVAGLYVEAVWWVDDDLYREMLPMELFREEAKTATPKRPKPKKGKKGDLGQLVLDISTTPPVSATPSTPAPKRVVTAHTLKRMEQKRAQLEAIERSLRAKEQQKGPKAAPKGFHKQCLRNLNKLFDLWESDAPSTPVEFKKSLLDTGLLKNVKNNTTMYFEGLTYAVLFLLFEGVREHDIDPNEAFALTVSPDSFRVAANACVRKRKHPEKPEAAFRKVRKVMDIISKVYWDKIFTNEAP